jgi:tRNA(Arg) A34 adenosine deaminase TadA
MNIVNLYHNLDILKQKMLFRQHLMYNVAAVVLDRKGNPISYGFNSYAKTHPKQHYNKVFSAHKIYLHAETDALYKIHKADAVHTMIVCRLGKKNQFLLAKPCVGCFSELKVSGLKYVYYTNNDGELVLLNLETDIDSY